MIRTLAKRLAKPVLQRATGARLLWRGPSKRRRVALTFDDGPHELTARTLAVLAELRVPATFFLMGAFVDGHPDVIAEYLRGGHQVAGHGYFHQRFTMLSPPSLRAELVQMERALELMPHGRWVRPPHGTIGPLDVSTMLASGYVIALWSLDSCDHDGSPAEVIAERCRPDLVRPGEVILFHEGQESTLAALPTIVERLLADGYELTTMLDLFES